MKHLIIALSLVPALAHAEPRKKLFVRAGIAYVPPFATAGELALAAVDGPASLAVSNGPVPGSGASVESTTIPALIIGYVLPVMNGKLAIETILGPPLDVKFDATGSLANMSLAPSALGIPTGVPALGPQLGEAKGVPPVFTLVYSLGNSDKIRPYVGGGVAMLFAYNAHTTNPMLTSSDMSIAPAPGLALQTGLEATIYKRIYARLDVKFIALMYARAEVHHIQMNAPDIPLFGTVEVGTAKIGTWVNPLIVQAGIGTDFW
jgi:outer membrane protein W